MKAWWLVGYRLAVVVGLWWLVATPQRAAVTREPGVLYTSPQCDHIVGYSGPSGSAIRLDAAGKIRSVELLWSEDTAEHVAAVREDPAFFARFVGLGATDELQLGAVDGVSRATLTSLAIVEAVNLRLTGVRMSTRFPDAITLEEIQALLPTAASIEPRELGLVVRAPGDRWEAVATGPLTESIVGYQGPTDMLLVFDAADKVRHVRIRASYDNEKYVGYVRDDPYFAEQFVGVSRHDLAKGKEIDGVSGATMTSEAIARGIAITCERMRGTGLGHVESFRYPLGTLVAVLLAVLLTYSRLRSSRVVRLVTRVAIVGYLGWFAGAMLSQALLIGWAAHGLPETAPGLVLLAGVAFAVPAVTGRQIYCHQLCAHGAAQELLRHTPWRAKWPGWLAKLRPLRAVVLIVIGLAVALGSILPWHLVEPFGAWAFPLVGTAVAVLFVVSLVLSARYPMAYCRVACPTGALLDFVRRRGATDRFRRIDAVAGLLLVAACARYVL